MDIFSFFIKNTSNSAVLTGLGQLMLLATFVEDSIRIVSQWNHQMAFMQDVRGIPWFLSFYSLFALVGTMISGIALVLAGPKRRALGAFFLICVLLLQTAVYGLLLDANFLLRSCSIVGGLVLLIAHNSTTETKKRTIFGGLPVGLEKTSRIYLPLIGRILLMLLCGSSILTALTTGSLKNAFLGGSFSIPGANSQLVPGSFQLEIAKGIAGVTALVSGCMVAVGFKARTSAALLLGVLLLTNMLLFLDLISLGLSHPLSDFIKYDFFQTISIMGGFILLIQLGPGEMSVDMKANNYLD